MDQFVLGSIYNIDFEENFRIQETNINIMKKNELVNQLINTPHFFMNVGANNIKALLSNDLHFSQHRFEGEQEFPPMYLVSLQKFLTQTFFTSLWLVKDNAVNSGNFYWWDTTENVITDIPVVLFSNSKGEYMSTPFSNDEINTANRIHSKVIEYTTNERNGEEQFVGEEGNINNYNRNNSYPNDRISRALRFIIIARCQSFLPAKISSYISAIEALISSNRESLSMQVSERVPKIIGGSIEDKILYHDKLKESYNVRSKFVHGDRISVNIARKIEQVSVDLDDLVRKLILKVINEYEDIKNFDENSLTKWYKETFMF